MSTRGELHSTPFSLPVQFGPMSFRFMLAACMPSPMHNRTQSQRKRSRDESDNTIAHQNQHQHCRIEQYQQQLTTYLRMNTPTRKYLSVVRNSECHTCMLFPCPTLCAKVRMYKNIQPEKKKLSESASLKPNACKVLHMEKPKMCFHFVFVFRIIRSLSLSLSPSLHLLVSFFYFLAMCFSNLSNDRTDLVLSLPHQLSKQYYTVYSVYVFCMFGICVGISTIAYK